MINLKVAYLRERNYSTEDLAQAPRIESEITILGRDSRNSQDHTISRGT